MSGCNVQLIEIRSKSKIAATLDRNDDFQHQKIELTFITTTINAELGLEFQLDSQISTAYVGTIEWH